MKKALTSAVLAGLFLTACNMGDSGTVKIGVIAPMSGDAAVYGEEKQNVLDPLLLSVNEAAMESGMQFEFVYEDGQCDGAPAAIAAQKLADIDGVDFILGGVCSSESLAIAPLLEENGMIALSAMSSSPELRDISPSFFSLSYSDDAIGMEIASQLSQYETVAILSEQNDYNQALLDAVVANISEGTEVVFNEQFVKGETNLRNDLEKLQAAGAEAIFLNPNGGATAEAMALQMNEMGDWDQFMIAPFTLMADDIVSKNLAVLNGLKIVDAPVVDSEEFTAFMEGVSADNIGDYYAASTATSFTILSDLIIEHEGDVSAIQEALSTGSFSGHLGSDLSFGGQTFLQGVGTAQFEIKDGELISL